MSAAVRTRPAARTIRLRPMAVALAIAAAACFWPRAFAENRPSEYDVKAAFLYNFIKYVDWPTEGGNTLTVAVIGKDPFGASLNSLAGKSVKGKTIALKRLTEVRDVSTCQLLFVSSSEKDRLKPIVEAATRNSVLTVGDTANYAQHGIVINLRTDGNKVRFEINTDAAERSKLKLSSQLLKLARIVRG